MGDEEKGLSDGNGYFKGKILTELAYIKLKIEEHGESINAVTQAATKILSEDRIREIFEKECGRISAERIKEGCPAGERLFQTKFTEAMGGHDKYHRLNEGSWGIRTLIREYPARAIAGTILFVAYFNSSYRNAILDLVMQGQVSFVNAEHLRSNFVLTVVVVIALMYLFRSMIGKTKD